MEFRCGMGESRPDIPIPDGLQKLMQDFVVTVLRQQPDDLINHAVEYFNNLKVGCPHDFLGSLNEIQAQRDAELGITNEPESQNSQVKFATFADSPHDDDEEVRRSV